MKKKFAAGFAVAALVVVAAGAPATASEQPGGWLCTTVDPTPVYDHVAGDGTFVGYLFTLSAGRGFRVHYYHGGGINRSSWSAYYGHGAEHPDRDGEVRPEHLAC